MSGTIIEPVGMTTGTGEKKEEQGEIPLPVTSSVLLVPAAARPLIMTSRQGSCIQSI